MIFAVTHDGIGLINGNVVRAHIKNHPNSALVLGTGRWGWSAMEGGKYPCKTPSEAPKVFSPQPLTGFIRHPLRSQLPKVWAGLLQAYAGNGVPWRPISWGLALSAAEQGTEPFPLIMSVSCPQVHPEYSEHVSWAPMLCTGPWSPYEDEEVEASLSEALR